MGVMVGGGGDDQWKVGVMVGGGGDGGRWG